MSQMTTTHGGASAGLPSFLTSFVGRERELDACLGTLRTARLVTLLGPGGAGKTRLSIEVARKWRDANPADVWFVELAPVREPAQVAGAVAHALGLALDGSVDPEDALRSYLEQGRGLLLVDNCEQVVEGVADLATRLLHECPTLRVLATSREPLGVAGERRYPLPAMDTAAGAVSLFVDRARLVEPGFGLTAENAASVAAICERMDGLPLGIELAAAMVRVMPLDQVVDLLKQSVSLLPSTDRSAPARQRTLTDAIRWSYDLLPEPERLLFGRLAVFAGGWTLDAAEDVCAGDGLERAEVLPLLASLVDRSVVVAEPGRGRYRMLEPVWEFARALDEWVEFGERHAAWYADWGERVGPLLRTRRAQDARAQIETEARNLRHSLAWSLEPDGNRIEFGLRLGTELSSYWVRTGQANEGASWMRAFLRHPLSRSRPSLRLRALMAGRHVFEWAGDDLEAECAAEMEQLLPEIGDQDLAADARTDLATRKAFQGQVDEARSDLLELLAFHRGRGAMRSVAVCLGGLAKAAAYEEDWKAHALATDEALPIAREIGDTWMEHNLVFGRADAAMARRELSAAGADFQRALGLVEQWGSGTTAIWMNLGMVALLAGDLPTASSRFKQSIALNAKGGDRLILAGAVGAQGVVVGLSGQPGLGTTLFACGVEAALKTGLPMTPADRQLPEQGAAILRSLMSSEEFERWYAEGTSMPLSQAVDEALAFEPAAAVPAGSLPRHPAGLSEREAEVLRLVAEGRTNREIAAELVLGVRTVENHVFNAYAKIGAGGRAEATSWAIRNGIAAA